MNGSAFFSNPITQRRWQNFQRNKRARWSLWIFAVVFVLTLFAELIANDKPLLVSYDGTLHTPFLVEYAETVFGGEFETEADYRDPFVIDLIQDKGWMIWPIIQFSYSTVNYDLTTPAPSPPDAVNWLGTDDQGRDVLARMIYGFRISVLFGFTLTIFSAVIGISLGALQGFYGGWLDLLAQRGIEIWAGMPTLYLLIIMASIITPNFWWLLGLLLLFSWISFVGGVRAEFFKARNLDFVRAARALGVTDRVIMVKHVLPNAMIVTISIMPFVLTGSVTALTSLDFLGFGLPPGSPSLGELLSQGKENLQAPWLGFAGFFIIAFMLTLLVFVGEGVRDAFDPRKVFRDTGPVAEDATGAAPAISGGRA